MGGTGAGATSLGVSGDPVTSPWDTSKGKPYRPPQGGLRAQPLHGFVLAPTKAGPVPVPPNPTAPSPPGSGFGSSSLIAVVAQTWHTCHRVLMLGHLIPSAKRHEGIPCQTVPQFTPLQIYPGQSWGCQRPGCCLKGSQSFRGPQRGDSEQLNVPWVEMPTLIPAGVVPGDPQGAQCPRMPPPLLSPPDSEKTPSYWNEGARRSLELALALQPAARRAKNIILFMGDGESPGSQPGPAAPQQPGDMAHGW